MNIQEILNGKTLHLIDDSNINKEGKRTGTINIADGKSIGGNKWIAQIMPYGNDHGGGFLKHAEALAVGQLFAAAPDLLNACIEALEALKTHNIADWNAGDKLIKAIEKATK